MATTTHPVHPPLGPARAAWLLVTRSYTVYRQQWKLFLTGFLAELVSRSSHDSSHYQVTKKIGFDNNSSA